MEIHQVRYFLAVCEHLSFTQAARQCHVTQPSLSRAIQHLEKEFGGYLFDRRRSKVRLTELGKLVQPYLQEAWEQAQAAKKEARDYSSKAPTQLNLAIMCTIAPGLLIQMFSRFRSARPDINLDLIDGTAQSIEEQKNVFRTFSGISENVFRDLCNPAPERFAREFVPRQPPPRQIRNLHSGGNGKIVRC